ncbi:hypothetical protein R3P38DRAFT_2516384, partial [Favolaschia claudopus]
LNRRLYSIMTFMDKSINVYPLHKIMVQTDWGIPTSFNDASNLICEKGTSKPLRLWVVGEVTNQFWFNEEGYPARRVALSIQPLSSDMAELGKRMLHGTAMPRNSSDAFGPDQIRATRWMTRRGQRGQASTTTEFAEYYDAREYLKDKSVLEKLSVEQIVEHDLVLLEMQLGRYNADRAAEPKNRKRAMNSWQTFFDLQAVYLIKNAPGQLHYSAVLTGY